MWLDLHRIVFVIYLNFGLLRTCLVRYVRWTHARYIPSFVLKSTWTLSRSCMVSGIETNSHVLCVSRFPVFFYSTRVWLKHDSLFFVLILGDVIPRPIPTVTSTPKPASPPTIHIEQTTSCSDADSLLGYTCQDYVSKYGEFVCYSNMTYNACCKTCSTIKSRKEGMYTA